MATFKYDITMGISIKYNGCEICMRKPILQKTKLDQFSQQKSSMLNISSNYEGEYIFEFTIGKKEDVYFFDLSSRTYHTFISFTIPLEYCNNLIDQFLIDISVCAVDEKAWNDFYWIVKRRVFLTEHANKHIEKYCEIEGLDPDKHGIPSTQNIKGICVTCNKYVDYMRGRYCPECFINIFK